MVALKSVVRIRPRQTKYRLTPTKPVTILMEFYRHTGLQSMACTDPEALKLSLEWPLVAEWDNVSISFYSGNNSRHILMQDQGIVCQGVVPKKHANSVVCRIACRHFMKSVTMTTAGPLECRSRSIHAALG